MSAAEYGGPRPGELAIVQGPLCRVVELAGRDGLPGAVVADNDDETAVWVPLSWLIRVPLDGAR